MSIVKIKKEPLQRILDNTEITDDCWIWRSVITNSGYGVIKTSGTWTKAHRYSYELFVGDIDDGLTIDHLCRNKRCVNPKHLEPVTARENTVRSLKYRKLKERCKNNHEFKGDNYYLYRGHRKCRLCVRKSYLKSKSK